MKKILVFLLFLYQCSLSAQIVSWGPGTFVWTRNAPVHNPGSGGAKFAVDTTTFQVYEWISGTSWQSSGQRVEEISGTGAPAYTPGKHDSYIVVNKKTPNPELYYYFSGSWKLVGSGGGGGTSYTAGEGIAIDGTVIRIDTLDRLSFNTLPTLPGGIGTFRWNDTDGTLDLGMKGGNVTLQVGQESLARVVNKSGTTINNGQVVYVSGAQGNRIAVRIASASSDSTTNTVLGIATESIANNQEGYVTTEGLVRGLNTSAFPEGAPLYLSPTVPGGITATLPTAPNHEVIVGYCVRQHAVVGIIYANVQNGEGLNELHDVKLTSPTNGQVLTYNSGSKWWQNETLSVSSSEIEWPLLAPDGSATAPSYSFSTSPESGVFWNIPFQRMEIKTADGGVNMPGIALKGGSTNIDEESGGNIFLYGGESTGIDGIGGGIAILSGNASDGVGGNININSGSGYNGGAFNLVSGVGTSGQGGPFIMSAGNSISGQGGSFSATAGSGAQAGTFYLTAGNATNVDEPGGQFALLAGDALNGFGGILDIKGGNGSEQGGLVSLQAGNASNGTGGLAYIAAGNGTILGGSTTIYGGNATSADATGGLLSLIAGDASNGFGGPVTVTAGTGLSEGGNVTIQAGPATGGSGGMVGIVGGNGTLSGGSTTIYGGNATTGNGGNVALSSGIGPTSAQNGKITMFGNGVVIPNLSTTQQAALTGITTGTLLYNSTSNTFEGYDGTRFIRITSTAIPTIAIAGGAGTGGTVSLKTGSNDIDGQIIITTGTSPLAGATLCTLTFAKPFASTARVSVIVGASSDPAAAMNVYPSSVGSNSFKLQMVTGQTAPASTANILFNYHVGN